jgi:hypothetical protein
MIAKRNGRMEVDIKGYFIMVTIKGTSNDYPSNSRKDQDVKVE